MKILPLIRNRIKAWREGRHPEYFDPPVYEYPCPVCESISMTERDHNRDYDHVICHICGVHLSYEDCFGGHQAAGRLILRDAWQKAGRPQWRIERNRPGYECWIERFFRDVDKEALQRRIKEIEATL